MGWAAGGRQMGVPLAATEEAGVAAQPRQGCRPRQANWQAAAHRPPRGARLRHVWGQAILQHHAAAAAQAVRARQHNLAGGTMRARRKGQFNVRACICQPAGAQCREGGHEERGAKGHDTHLPAGGASRRCLLVLSLWAPRVGPHRCRPTAGPPRCMHPARHLSPLTSSNPMLSWQMGQMSSLSSSPAAAAAAGRGAEGPAAAPHAGAAAPAAPGVAAAAPAAEVPGWPLSATSAALPPRCAPSPAAAAASPAAAAAALLASRSLMPVR